MHVRCRLSQKAADYQQNVPCPQMRKMHTLTLCSPIREKDMKMHASHKRGDKLFTFFRFPTIKRNYVGTQSEINCNSTLRPSHSLFASGNNFFFAQKFLFMIYFMHTLVKPFLSKFLISHQI